ncbi:MAG: hypothetical protein ABH952_00720 [Candidatus Omnitrophota bacterium]
MPRVKIIKKIDDNTKSNFGTKLKIPFIFEVVRDEGVDLVRDEVRVISASKFLSGLV